VAVKVNEVEVLKAHFLKVVERADNHVQSVNEVIYPLLAFIVLIMDDESDLQIRSNDDNTGNMLWLTTRGHRYAFRYEESDDAIVIRKANFTGPVVAKVNNSTGIGELKQVFAML